MNTDQFSKREKEVSEFLLLGKSNKQIALALGISVSTVEYHLKNIYKKLQANSRIDAVLKLRESISDNKTNKLGESINTGADKQPESIVDEKGAKVENEGNTIPIRRIPANKMFKVISVGLLTPVLGVVCVLAVVLVLNNTQSTPISPTPTDIPTLILTPTYTPTPVECRFNNLINCSAPPIAVYVPNESFSSATLISGKLLVDFHNSQQNTSGVVFQFKPPLNTQGFRNLELVGTSTESFMFLVEYKVNDNNQLKIVTTSPHQSFPMASATITILIPITYDGLINEIGINFFTKDQSAKLIIESLRLK